MSQDHPEVRMPPPLLHLGGLLIGHGLDQALNWSLPAFPGRQGIAATLALIAIALLLTALLQLTRGRTTVMPHRAARVLITDGIFRLSRNPIYLAFALLHLACALSLGSPGMLLMLVAVLWVMHSHVIAAEETFHEQKFGAQWQAYRQRVRRWL
ncbi:MAG TPA: isoprenylcysteine carboxylmethyltransferase family protein [Alcanivorax sp.]|nr:isoprenylcysteine carboxylmethyltransferase family protein [Alcanivorax sp.]